MKTFVRFHLIVAVLAAFAATACSTSPLGRIDANRGAYESWPIDVREAVLAGRVEKGMTPEQVEMALGKPSEIISRASRSGQDEVWVYRKGSGASSLLKNTEIAIGGGMGGVSVGGGGGGGHAVADQEEVVFRDGVVVRAETL